MKPGMFGQNDPKWSAEDGGKVSRKAPVVAPYKTERKRRQLTEPVYQPAIELIREWSEQSWFWPAIITIILIIAVVLGINHISAMAALGLS